ncbi:MAG TPA: TerC family protein, partial [Candidatus Limnocylindria bacterium]|nr:TerC family protein [Candidatus Limnocylindria bacterium]
LVFRAIFILVGASLLHHFEWLAYGFGAFLAYSGLKLLWMGDADEKPDLSQNHVVRFMRRFFPICQDFDEDHFTSFDRGRRILTPLAVVLAVVETTDVIFAVDSIPAVFGITTNSFVVFTSNVFAIMGLRSLYFVLVRAIGYFRYLKPAMALVLVVIGVKMLAAHWLKQWLGDSLRHWSLGLVGALLLVGMGASVIAGYLDRHKHPKE